MWKRSSAGIHRRSYGSKWFWGFLLAFWLSSAYSLSAQTPPDQKPYSQMTRSELLNRIAEQDLQLDNWLTLYDQWTTEQDRLTIARKDLQESLQTVKNSLKERDEAFADQLATRDKLISDQAAVIAGYEAKESVGWIEKIVWSLAGFGLGFVGGWLAK